MLALLLAVSPGYSGQAAELTPTVLGVGFSVSGFVTVNRNDAEAGFKAILKTIGLKHPQVGQALQVVAVSEPFVNAVICLNDSGWTTEEGKSDIIRGLTELHLEPAGQQILSLFKSGQLIPFQEKHLESVRKLRTTSDQLRTKANQDRPAHPGQP